MSTLEQALGGPVIEVVAKATRRRFTVEYKRKVVREADACKTSGAVGALLRREGLYSSHLTTWTYFYLYVMLDVFSRYVVGWMVAHRESATLAETPKDSESCRKRIAR